MSDKKTLLIFDCFGVVIHCVSEYWMATIPSLKDKKELVNKYMDEGDRGIISTFDQLKLLSSITGEAPEDIFNDFNRLATPIQGTLDFIKKHRHEFKFLMLSNANTGFLDGVLDRFHIRDYFDGIIISSDYKIAKPDKEIFLLAKNYLGEFDQYIFADDHEENIVAAEKYGIRGILFTDINSYEIELKKYLNI